MKISILLIIALAGGAIYWVKESGEISVIRKRLMEVEAYLDELREQHSSQGRYFELRKDVMAKVKAVSILEASTHGMDEELRTLRAEKLRLEKALKDRVFDNAMRERTAAIGLKFDQLVLVNGRVLKNVEIKKIGDGQVSMAHSEGILAVSHENLPEDLKNRLRLDLGPSR